MPYNKNIWVDEVLAGDARYDIAEDGGTPIESNAQISLATGVIVPGTPVDANRMNNIEDGLEALYNDQGHALGRVLSLYSMLYGLKGFWPFGGRLIGTTASVPDMSGCGMTLTHNGGPISGLASLVPYMNFNGSTQYLARADDSNLDILGNESIIAGSLRGLTLGCWLNLSALSGGSSRAIITKSATTSNQRSYRLYLTGGDVIQLSVSPNGSTVTEFSHSFTPSISTWYFVVGRWVPSTSLDIWINDSKAILTASIPAAPLFNSTSAFQIGAGATTGGGESFLSGAVALPFISSAALPDALIDMLFQQTRVLFGV